MRRYLFNIQETVVKSNQQYLYSYSDRYLNFA